MRKRRKRSPRARFHEECPSVSVELALVAVFLTRVSELGNKSTEMC